MRTPGSCLVEAWSRGARPVRRSARRMPSATPPGEAVALDLGAIFFREVTLQSTYSAGPYDTRDALELIASGRVDAEALVSHRLPLHRIEEAFALARSGEATKVVVEP